MTATDAAKADAATEERRRIVETVMERVPAAQTAPPRPGGNWTSRRKSSFDITDLYGDP